MPNTRAGEGSCPDQPPSVDAQEGESTYANDKRWMDKTGIPLSSIKDTSVVYAAPPIWSILFMIVGGSLIHLFHNGEGILLPLIPGLLSRDDVKNLQWGLLSRVSSSPQLTNTSTGTQLDRLKQEVEKVDGTIRKKFEVAESAATTRRDSLEELATLAENNEIDIIGVSKLDRLTRADPWESLDYLKRLRESDTVLYAGTHGYFEWDSLYDFEKLVRQAVFAREWYERLRKNAEDGQISKLQEGKWPFGKAPYGYALDEDQNIYLTQEGSKIIPQIFNLYQETENKSEVQRQVEEIHNLESLPSTSQIDTILTHRICLGELTLKEEVICRDQQLEVVDRETFKQVQQILRKQGSTSNSVPEIPDSINEIAYDLGVRYTINQLSSVSKVCKKCGGELRKNGTKEQWETTLQNYVCKNCGHQSLLLTQSEFDEFHQTLPLQCPFCPATERFEIEHTPHMDYEFAYRCEQCGNQFGINTLPDKYQRAIENPELAIDWYSDPVRQRPTCESSDNEPDVENEPNQKALTEF